MKKIYNTWYMILVVIMVSITSGYVLATTVGFSSQLYTTGNDTVIIETNMETFYYNLTNSQSSDYNITKVTITVPDLFIINGIYNYSNWNYSFDGTNITWYNGSISNGSSFLFKFNATPKNVNNNTSTTWKQKVDYSDGASLNGEDNIEVLNDPSIKCISLYNLSEYVINESGTYVICNETYYMKGINNNAILVNASNVTLYLNGTTIIGPGYGVGINITYQSNVLITGGTIYNYSEGIFLVNTNDSNITDITTYNDTYDGIFIYKGVNNYIDNVTVYSSDLYFHDNNGGIQLYNTNYTNITNSIIYNISGPGIYLRSSKYSKYERNFINYSGKGFFIRDSTNNFIINNTINNSVLGSEPYGIYVNDSNMTSFTNNIIVNSGLYGIIIRLDAKNISLLNNTIYNNDGGIKITGNSENITVKGGDIYNNTDGVYIYNCSNNLVDNTNIFKNSDSGIYLYYSSNNTLTNNNISLNSNNGIYLYESSKSNMIINNTIYNNSYGIYLRHDSINNTLFSDNISDNQKDGILVYYDSSINVSNSNISSNGWRGIYLYSSSTNNIYYSNISSNGWNGTYGLNYKSGVYIYFSNSNNISNNTIYSNYGDGIYILNSGNKSRINYNNISKNQRDGIYICGASDKNTAENTFIGNMIINNTGYGIGINSTFNNTFISNKIITSINGSGIKVITGQSGDYIRTINESEYIQSIDTSNLINGKSIYYIVNDNDTTIVPTSNNISFLGLVNCINYTVYNFNLSIKNYDSVLLVNTNNSSIYGFNINSDSSNSVRLEYDNNVTVYNFSIISNNSKSVELNYNSNLTIYSSYISDSDYGIDIHMTNYSIFNSINITNTSTAFNFYFSLGDILEDSIITNSTNRGVYLSLDNGTIYNNNISNNVYGIQIPAVNPPNPGYTCKNNLIYNNYFSNTYNLFIPEFSANLSGTHFNTTKILSTNIIDGPYIAGNYWSDYSGGDTNGDGIGDINLPYKGTVSAGGYLSDDVADNAPLVSQNTIPTIYIMTPNGSTIAGIGFNFTDPDNSTASCTVYANGTNVSYNNSVYNNTTTYISINGLTDNDTYWIWVICNDGVWYNNSLNYSYVYNGPPAPVSNLRETITTQTSILWEWDNPSNSDLDHVEIWLDGIFKDNRTYGPNTYGSWTATNLNPGTRYEIEVRTVDTNGNIGSWVNDSATTNSEAQPGGGGSPGPVENKTKTDLITKELTFNVYPGSCSTENFEIWLFNKDNDKITLTPSGSIVGAINKTDYDISEGKNILDITACLRKDTPIGVRTTSYATVDDHLGSSINNTMKITIISSGILENCSSSMDLVCGDDGHTYLNKCYANAFTEVSHIGACTKEEEKPITKFPVSFADVIINNWILIILGIMALVIGLSYMSENRSMKL